MIELHQFEKYYGKFQAVRPTSFSVARGEVFGLLGPNGSGKSTIIKAIVGLLKPNGGKILVDGVELSKNPVAVQRLISYIPQRICMPDNLTGKEVLEFYASLRGCDQTQVNEVLELTRLAEHRDKYVGEYSGGLLQRLGLAVAIIGETPILILDEPTLNLDPRGMKLLRQFVQTRKAQGATILFASHILADAESFADRVGIMVEGQLVRVDQVDTLHQEIQDRTTVVLKIAERKENLLARATKSGASRVWFENGDLRFIAPLDQRLAVLQALDSAGAIIDQFATETPKLDTLIMEHFGED
ncbi:MAG: ABC transporter ATP-binding protein [Candidatus Marinimicrobia bacterium]|nr:ABC transporter ATP-binding protein [Candidatus Neomarinimicrobiota bacterium]